MLLEGGADPCAAARTIASAQDTQLESCTIEDEDVTVTIRSPTGVPRGGVGGTADPVPVRNGATFRETLAWNHRYRIR